MDAATYLATIVEPTIAEFEAEPTSVRRAFLACVVTFHTIDRLAWPKRSRGLRAKLRETSRDFAVVDDVAHAMKHVVARKGAPSGSLQDQSIIARPPARWNEAVWDLSRWDDATGGVTLSDRRGIDLLAVIEGAVSTLRAMAS